MIIKVPKVSVVVPNYNHSKYLQERIDSILKQTYQNFELIILDDCSTDNSREIIKAYSEIDDRVEFVFNTENSGSPFSQWYRGLSLSSGEYIWIAESDDFSDSKFLKTLVDALDSHPNVGLAYSQSWSVDEDGSVINSYRHWTNDLDGTRWSTDYVNDGKEEIKRYFCFKNTIPNASAVVFRRKYVLTEDKVEETMRLSGDKIFWGKIMLQSEMLFISQHYNYFRHHSNNARTKTAELEVIIDNFKWLSWLSENISIPLEDWKTIRNKLYVWSAGYALHEPKSIFKLLETHSKFSFDVFFNIKIFFFIVKELLYRKTLSKHCRNVNA